MNDAAFVQVFESSENAEHHLDSRFDGWRLPVVLLKPGLKRTVSDILAHDHDLPVITFGLDNRQHVRMAARLHPDFRFLLDSFDLEVCIFRKLEGESGGDDGRAAFGQPDDAEISFADFTGQRVGADLRLGLEHRLGESLR